MKRLLNEPMSRHTTFHIGGAVDEFLIPETERELVDVFAACVREKRNFRVLGNGSNVLVSDEGLQGCVIENSRACVRLEIEDGRIYAGASVKVQQFIRFCVKNHLQAPEYLFSVPATIGGAIFMNAGRGRAYNRQISDDLECVRAYDASRDSEILLPRAECGFEYRRSIFHDRRDWLVLGAWFRPGPQPQSVGEARIKERMQFVKESQDYNHPTAGSVFKQGEHHIFERAKGLRLGGAQYSGKTTNWINNVGNARARDIERLIRVVQLLHLVRFKRAVPEIEIWK